MKDTTDARFEIGYDSNGMIEDDTLADGAQIIRNILIWQISSDTEVC